MTGAAPWFLAFLALFTQIDHQNGYGAGVTPEIRCACPKFAGKLLEFLADLDGKALDMGIIDISRDLDVLHMAEAFDLFELTRDKAFTFNLIFHLAYDLRRGGFELAVIRRDHGVGDLGTF